LHSRNNKSAATGRMSGSSSYEGIAERLRGKADLMRTSAKRAREESDLLRQAIQSKLEEGQQQEREGNLLMEACKEVEVMCAKLTQSEAERERLEQELEKARRAISTGMEETTQRLTDLQAERDEAIAERDAANAEREELGRELAMAITEKEEAEFELDQARRLYAAGREEMNLRLAAYEDERNAAILERDKLALRVSKMEEASEAAARNASAIPKSTPMLILTPTTTGVDEGGDTAAARKLKDINRRIVEVVGLLSRVTCPTNAVVAAKLQLQKMLDQ